MTRIYKHDLGGTSHEESKPDFMALARVDAGRGNSKFVKIRKECYDLGLTLERLKKGYIMYGPDMPVSGIECRNLIDVEEEMDNFK